MMRITAQRMFSRGLHDVYTAVSLSVPCTYCGALAGEWCRKIRYSGKLGRFPDDGPVPYVHGQRQTAARPVYEAVSLARVATFCPVCGANVRPDFPEVHRCAGVVLVVEQGFPGLPIIIEAAPAMAPEVRRVEPDDFVPGLDVAVCADIGTVCR